MMSNLPEGGPRPDSPVALFEQHAVRYELVLPDADEDYIQQKVLSSGVPYELEMLQNMRARLHEGDLVLDVGANVGNHTLYLACVIRARVVAFEPNAHLCAAMEESIARNGVGQLVSVRPVGIGAVEARARFERAIPANLGAQRLVLGNGELHVVPLDQLNFDGAVRAIKIDVEGMEADVLRGAQALVVRDRPILYVECGDEASFREVMLWAEAYRYTYWETFNYTPTHLLLPVETVSVDERIERLNWRYGIEEYRLMSRVRRTRKILSEERERVKQLADQIDAERSARSIAEAEASALREKLENASVRSSHLEKRCSDLEKALLDQGERSAIETARVTASLDAERESARANQAEHVRKLRRINDELGNLRTYGRDLERRYLTILESETWKVMEPVRTFLRWIRRRPPAEPFVPRLRAGEDLAPKPPQDEAAKVESRKVYPSTPGGLPVDDLVQKLWGGFSGYALRDLSFVEKNVALKEADRVKAAWNLARWTAAAGDWESCLSHLGTIAYIDKSFFRTMRSRLLTIEANLRTGKITSALEYVYHGLNRQLNGNYVCALSNVLLMHGVWSRLDSERLAALNKLYELARISPLTTIDPEKGLTFSNLSAAPPPPVGDDGPKVSVLVPVFNASGFLETAISSILAQSWRNLEIIAVDDSSTDESWEILQRLSKLDSRLRTFRNETNLGAYPTRNRALSQATGDLVTVHDSDDWSHPQMIEVQVRPLMSTSDVKATFSAMARVLPNMEFMLRPERNILEYVHRSYPSLMMRRADMARLHQWDGVAANADDELVQRARAIWGAEALQDVLPNVPLSFFLRHDQSLTESKDTHLRSLTFGIRQEYAQQAEFWRKTVSGEQGLDATPMERTDLKTPFPIPSGLAPRNWRRDSVYDLVIVSDLSLLGGTRRCNEGYIEAATKLGLRVGLFHWPRYDLVLAGIAPEYRRLSYRSNVDILVPEDSVECELVLIHHPPILKHRIDAIPKIKTQQVRVLVNQLPMQQRGEAPHYYIPSEVDALCTDLFGQPPVWMPISPLARRFLAEVGVKQQSDIDWFPPLGRSLQSKDVPARLDVGSDRPVVLGRHSRDHWTKWPEKESELRAAYCADTEIIVRLMGGVSYPRKVLQNIPGNWQTISFDQTSVDEFLAGLDFLLHFVKDDYIEEFGRNVMEAMACGVPVVLPHSFRENFGDAAVYCDASEVAATVRRLWSDPPAYRALSEKGYEFVLRTSDQRVVMERLSLLIRGGRTPGLES